MAICRYLSEERPKEKSGKEGESNLDRMQKHFGFLLDTVKRSYGELDLQLRNNYFNVYFRGNSLAKVTFLPDDEYAVEIHERFLKGTGIASGLSTDTSGKQKGRVRIRVKAFELHTLLQVNTIRRLKRNIRDVNNGEETTFEQLLISDNPPTNEFFIIDRQVTDSDLNRKRLDLLALENTGGNQYRFVVIEVKLGKNPELREKVAEQLALYVSHISGAAFRDYRACYSRNYEQKKILGLLPLPHQSIEIVEGVRGLVVVGGYSALAAEQIEELKKSHPEIKTERFRNRIGAGLHGG